MTISKQLIVTGTLNKSNSQQGQSFSSSVATYRDRHLPDLDLVDLIGYILLLGKFQHSIHMK
jgi:hypothetical protein